jgi:hypothetical protein
VSGKRITRTAIQSYQTDAGNMFAASISYSDSTGETKDFPTMHEAADWIAGREVETSADGEPQPQPTVTEPDAVTASEVKAAEHTAEKVHEGTIDHVQEPAQDEYSN